MWSSLHRKREYCRNQICLITVKDEKLRHILWFYWLRMRIFCGFISGYMSSTYLQTCSERNSLYKKRYDEGYDIHDDDYLRWIRENKLELPTKGSSSQINSTSSKEVSSHTVETSSACSTHCGGNTGSSLSEILVVLKPVCTKKEMTSCEF